jgi:hypothetical protein
MDDELPPQTPMEKEFYQRAENERRRNKVISEQAA